MASFRNMDTFMKVRNDLRSRSAIGGIVTVLATISAALLFIAELYFYIRGMTRHSLQISESTSIPILPNDNFYSARHKTGKIPLKIHVTFPHLSCDELDFTMNDASLSSGTLTKTHGRQSIVLRTPRNNEKQELIKSDGGADTFTKDKTAQQAAPAMAPGGGGGSSNSNNKQRDGCTVIGNLRIPIVAGDFTITVTRKAWSAATSSLLFGLLDASDLFNRGPDRQMPRMYFNMSHYIHKIQFGKPYAGGSGSNSFDGISIEEVNTSPLQGVWHVVDNKFGGIALQQMQVRLIPTKYRRFFTEQNAYQLSVIDHTVQPETLVGQGTPMLPGIAVYYDFSPLAVHHIEMRDNIVVFLGSLVSIVGGVFVTVSLVAGCFMNTAAAVAKKLD